MKRLNTLLLILVTPLLTQCVESTSVNKKNVTAAKTVGDSLGPTAGPTGPSTPTTPTTPKESFSKLNGDYIPAAYASGCAPATLSDFMETGIGSRRKVEPRDCALVTISNPIFSWVMPLDTDVNVPATFTLTKVSTGTVSSLQVLKRARLIYPTELEDGQYKWVITYTNTRNQVISSQVRRFSVKSNGLKIPLGPEIVDIVVNKARPRALPASITFSALASRLLTSEYKASYQAYLNRTSVILTYPVTAIPANLARNSFTSDLEYNTWTRALTHSASSEKNYIEQLSYAYYFTNNTTYQTNAINRLLALAQWPVDGATSEAVQDQANREIYVALALGLDLFQGQLTSAQRTMIVTALKARLSQVMVKFSALDISPYDSHLLTSVQFSTEALMYAVGTPEFPEARDLLSHSWNVMITNSGNWGGYDGAYGQGGAYGWYSMNTIARTMAYVKLITNVNLQDWPVFGKFGYNQIAFYPANALLMGQFGNDIENKRHYFDYSRDAFRLMGAVAGNPDYEWYWRADSTNVGNTSAISPLHYLVLGMKATNPIAPTGIPQMADSFLFEDAGLVAMHSKTTNSLRSSVFFRSSKLGSYNHSHADNNAFTYVSKGKEIFISGGYYPYYNSPHNTLVNRATRFKNALTFNGGIGQSEPSQTPTAPDKPVTYVMDARGKLVNFVDTGVWAITTGDATRAYRGYNMNTDQWGAALLTNAVRSVAYNRSKGVVIIYDWATSATAKTWELNFQTLFSVAQISSSLGTTIKAVNGTSSACVNIFGPTGSYSFTSGFPIEPEVAQPTQSQTRWSVSTPSKELVSVTVIREDCKELPVSVTFTGRSARVNIDGSTIIAEEKTIQY